MIFFSDIFNTNFILVFITFYWAQSNLESYSISHKKSINVLIVLIITVWERAKEVLISRKSIQCMLTVLQQATISQISTRVELWSIVNKKLFQLMCYKIFFTWERISIDIENTYRVNHINKAYQSIRTQGKQYKVFI